MDRFIDISYYFHCLSPQRLKSNMDRFIVCRLYQNREQQSSLKSNMDRFIDLCQCRKRNMMILFKIQYG